MGAEGRSTGRAESQRTTPPGLRVAAIVLAVGATVAVSPSGARAAHFQPSVSATLVDEGTSGAWRNVRVDVAADCGPLAGAGTLVEVAADIHGTWAGDTRAPYTPRAGSVESLDPDDGGSRAVAATSYRYRIGQGLRAVARADVTCTSPPDPDTGAQETATAVSPFTAPLQAPYRLGAWFFGASYSNRKPSCRFPERVMEVGAGYDLKWTPDVDVRGLIGKAQVAAADIPNMRIHFAGGGRAPLTTRPSRKGFLRYRQIVNGFYFFVRRAKPVRIWITIGGVSSEVTTIPVRPRPRACFDRR